MHRSPERSGQSEAGGGHAEATTREIEEADLIVDVYGRLGLLSQGRKQRLLDTLPLDIAELRHQHKGVELEPFLAVNLTDAYGAAKLYTAVSRAYMGALKVPYFTAFTTEIDPATRNKRTIGAESPVEHLSLRGAVMLAEHHVDEPGLTCVGMTIEEQRQRAAAAGLTLHNQADWLMQDVLLEQREQRKRAVGWKALDSAT